jgi:hypothetical protein
MHRTIKLLVAVVGVVATVAGAAVAATTPSVSTGKATSIQDTSAVLNGTVVPNGSTSFYHFEWGLTTAYGLTSSLHSAGSGKKAIAVKTTAGQLIPGTVYHFRLTALSRSGGSIGSDRTFRTSGNPPPAVSTGAPSALGANSATVTGIVNPNNQATQWSFEYGLTTQYTASTPVQTIPATKLVLPVSAQLVGLQAGATFHYRLVAVHSNSVPQPGVDMTFVTHPSPRPKPRVLVKTTPRRDRSRPYPFTSSGRVTTSRSLPTSVQCAGSVTAHFYNGRRRVASSLFALGPDCRFSGTTTFHRLPGHGKRGRHVNLTVQIRFSGNPYLAPGIAHAATVTLG